VVFKFHRDSLHASFRSEEVAFRRFLMMKYHHVPPILLSTAQVMDREAGGPSTTLRRVRGPKIATYIESKKKMVTDFI
jgi:hypothetical protein